jgi:hypothetical protein
MLRCQTSTSSTASSAATSPRMPAAATFCHASSWHTPPPRAQLIQQRRIHERCSLLGLAPRTALPRSLPGMWQALRQHLWAQPHCSGGGVGPSPPSSSSAARSHQASTRPSMCSELGGASYHPTHHTMHQHLESAMRRSHFRQLESPWPCAGRTFGLTTSVPYFWDFSSHQPWIFVHAAGLFCHDHSHYGNMRRAACAGQI